MQRWREKFAARLLNRNHSSFSGEPQVSRCVLTFGSPLNDERHFAGATFNSCSDVTLK